MPEFVDVSSEDDIPFYEESIPRTVPYHKPPPDIFDTPKSIYGFLDEQVYGHHAFKKHIAFFIWQMKNGHRPAALLIAGNSGEGKTETIRALQKIYKNIAVTDGASITPEGFKGKNKFSSNINLLDPHNSDQPPIMVIDEVDKLICRGGWNNMELTAELLKLMEDTVLDISLDNNTQNFISTKNMGFILLGSFSHLSERTDGQHPIGFGCQFDESRKTQRKPLTKEIIMDQLSPELIGRIGHIIILDPFDQGDFENILEDERYSPISHAEKEYNIHINISPQKRKEIAASAFSNKTGVRSMKNEIFKCLTDELFENPNLTEITM